MEKENLFGKTLVEIKSVTDAYKLPGFTAKQIADWMYQKDVTSISDMTNLSKKARASLEEDYFLKRESHIKCESSTDGTKKYLFSIKEKFVEAAYIPEQDRSTLCVSSQVGCKMGCLFCLTGKQGYQGNLSAGEILNQIYSLPEKDKLTNIVYMGMGEPMDNIENVLNSLEILTADYGLAWSPKRITVSTIGVIPAMEKFINESNCHLAISLHNPFHEERLQLMPIESVYPISDIIKLLKSHDFGRQRRVSFEYIMFKGVNDSANHIKGLTQLLSGLRCRVNLIRFHSIPGTPLEGSDEETIQEFKEALNAKGITTTIRASRGEDISAACGMLSTKTLVKKQESSY
jgi:23S rRNA (adenine2503-C2)-methyltransferase